ncbi:Hypothetical_protein [Hexamita inflata]|uniref:Hypothetical_protein n=1 Tax=Hexamita inflata TaxID=28002 RepID=A0ABP1J9W5_9EUKA
MSRLLQLHLSQYTVQIISGNNQNTSLVPKAEHIEHGVLLKLLDGRGLDLEITKLKIYQQFMQQYNLCKNKPHTNKSNTSPINHTDHTDPQTQTPLKGRCSHIDPLIIFQKSTRSPYSRQCNIKEQNQPFQQALENSSYPSQRIEMKLTYPRIPETGQKY